MSKSNTFENDWIKLIFQGTAIANIADNAASSPLTSLYCALHTADPGEAGNQTTSEASYTSYARVAVARNSGGWSVSGNSATLASSVAFPASTGGGTQTVTHFSVGTAASGTGKILYSGALTVAKSIATGDNVTLDTTTAITED